MMHINKSMYKKILVALFNLSVISSVSRTYTLDEQVAKTSDDKQALSAESLVPKTNNAAYRELMPKKEEKLKKINKIIILGNNLVDEQAIMNKVPYKEGENFDPRKTRKLIHNLYYGLKRIKNVAIYGKQADKKDTKRDFDKSSDQEFIDLVIKVDEKKVLKEIQFLPKKRSVGDEEFKKKININDIPALDEQELKRYELIIKNIYESKNYHAVKINSELKVDTDGRAIAIFNIEEGQKSKIKRVLFEGNQNISSKELKKLIFTREDWILGALDGSGSLQEDRLEADKHILEQHYQSEGYMKAKVLKADLKVEEGSKDFTVVFTVEEGDKFKISEVKAPGNDIYKDDYLVSRIPIKPGDLYSRKKIVDAIKELEMVWGDLGYIFANIEPSIQPDEDAKTVKLAFYTEQGEKVSLNKINIIGNKKTKDKVIRRKLMLEREI